MSDTAAGAAAAGDGLKWTELREPGRPPALGGGAVDGGWVGYETGRAVRAGVVRAIRVCRWGDGMLVGGGGGGC